MSGQINFVLAQLEEHSKLMRLSHSSDEADLFDESNRVSDIHIHLVNINELLAFFDCLLQYLLFAILLHLEGNRLDCLHDDHNPKLVDALGQMLTELLF
jgi:hypothetical protein